MKWLRPWPAMVQKRQNDGFSFGADGFFLGGGEGLPGLDSSRGKRRFQDLLGYPANGRVMELRSAALDGNVFCNGFEYLVGGQVEIFPKFPISRSLPCVQRDSARRKVLKSPRVINSKETSPLLKPETFPEKARLLSLAIFWHLLYI